MGNSKAGEILKESVHAGKKWMGMAGLDKWKEKRTTGGGAGTFNNMYYGLSESYLFYWNDKSDSVNGFHLHV